MSVSSSSRATALSPDGSRTVAIAHGARNSRSLHAAARVGFVVSGLVQAAIGVLALEVATDRLPGAADQAGALEAIAHAPGGAFVVGICAAGFVALGSWLALSAVLPRPNAGKRARALHAGDAAKAVVYLTLAATAVTVLVRGRDDSVASTRDLSAALLQLPGGPVLLGAVGVATIGIALHLVHKGVTRRFKADLALRSDVAERPVVALGVVGYVARGVAVGTVGALVVDAAVMVDPTHSTGLDAALRAMAALPLGQVVLAVVAAGWMASGVYAFVRAARATMR